ISSTILVQASLGAGAAIFAEASLSFLGAGIPPPAATWGGMLHDAYPYLEVNSWQTFVPGVCILLAVLSCNFIGDGLRDLLDRRVPLAPTVAGNPQVFPREASSLQNTCAFTREGQHIFFRHQLVSDRLSESVVDRRVDDRPVAG